jgi:uncharacterized protein (TIGR00730 family)
MEISQRSKYALGDDALNRAVDDIVALCNHPSADEYLIKEIIITALKMHLEDAETLDLKIASRALKEMRHSFRVFSEYADRMKVTVFGSARTQEDEPAYRLAEEFAAAMESCGFMVITGAGGGIMEAGNKGAGRHNSFGLNILLPFEQKPNRYIEGDPKLITFKYFFPRKLMFVKEADALALFPGGFGTLDECMELLTLVQTGKASPVPVVMMDVPGGSYWKSFVSFIADNMIRAGTIAPEDLSFVHLTDNVPDACSHIRRFYANYHSMRVVRDLLVLRLRFHPDERLLAQLNDEFADILRTGSFAASGPLEEEASEPDLAHLPRLVFPFDGRHYGRLRMLIDAVNDSVAGRLESEGRRPQHFIYGE